MEPASSSDPAVQPSHRAKALFAAALSLLAPGAGQVLLGYRRRGLAMLAITLLLVAGALLLWQRGLIELVVWLVQPRILIGAVGLNLAVLAFRMFAVLDAYRLAQRATVAGETFRTRLVTTPLLALLLAVVAVPHLAAGYYNLLFYDLLTDVFASSSTVSLIPTPNQSVALVPTPTATATATAVPSATPTATIPPQSAQAVPPRTDELPTPAPPTPTPEPTATPQPTATPVPPTPTTAPPPERLNVLLLGSDAGPGRWGVRTDVIMVATLDPATGRAALFSIPRNMVQVPFPAETANSLPFQKWPEMINALYGYGTANPQLFPGGNDPGANALKGAIGALLGIPIHYYAMVNMQGFVEVVDALGGVTIDVQFPMRVSLSPPGPDDEWRTYDIQAGRQHLDGYAALAYARSRTGNSDYHRMHRQRCVLGAVAREADPTSLLLAFPTLSDVIKGHVQTDIPLELLPELIRLGDQIDASQIVVVGFTPPAYTSGFAAGYPIPDVPLIQQRVQSSFDGSAEQQPSNEQVVASCGWTGE